MVNDSTQSERSGLYGQRMAFNELSGDCFAGWVTSSSQDASAIDSIVLNSKTVTVYARFVHDPVAGSTLEPTYSEEGRTAGISGAVCGHDIQAQERIETVECDYINVAPADS